MKEKSSIEWLLNQVRFYIPDKEKFEKLKSSAKQMHKEEIMTAYMADLFPCSDEDAEQFYKTWY
jgi:hypothetical protein